MTTIARLPDWRTRLHRYFAEAGRREFAWGSHDCATFAAGAVEAMTGTYPASRVTGRYTTPTGALRALRKAGFEDLVDAVAAEFEPTDNPQEGDIAIMRDNDGALALGIVGRGCVHCLSPGMGLWASYEPPVKAFAV